MKRILSIILVVFVIGVIGLSGCQQSAHYQADAVLLAGQDAPNVCPIHGNVSSGCCQVSCSYFAYTH